MVEEDATACSKTRTEEVTCLAAHVYETLFESWSGLPIATLTGQACIKTSTERQSKVSFRQIEIMRIYIGSRAVALALLISIVAICVGVSPTWRRTAQKALGNEANFFIWVV